MHLTQYRPTPAMVVAVVALVVALGGTSYAAISLPKNSVGNKQIKKRAVTGSKLRSNSVGSSKIKDSSLLRKDFAAKQLPSGAQGPAGRVGERGVAGATGAAGANGANGATKVVMRSQSASGTTATVGCQAGETVTGGGATALGPAGTALIESRPNQQQGVLLGWTGTGTTVTAIVDAYVICASP